MYNFLLTIKSIVLILVMSMTTMLQSANATTVIKTSMIDWVVNGSGHKVDYSVAIKIVSNVLKQSHLWNIDPLLLLSLIKNESGFKTTATSNYGAKGLMQVVPRWHKDKIAGRRITNIDINIEVGTKILNDCINRFKGSLKPALRCYSGNARMYSKKLNKTYVDIKKHDTKYRFKNDLPITLSGSFLKPREFELDDGNIFKSVAVIY